MNTQTPDSHERRVRALVAAWQDSSPAERRAGRRWYPAALDLAVAIDPDRPWRAAGVLAALSPRQSWHQNVASAALLTGWVDAKGSDRGPEPRVHTNGQQAKARAIANGETPLVVLHGPKERAFYRAITGDTDAVTVDAWAARAAEPWEDPNAGIHEARYNRLVRAYQDAAERLSVTPRDLQATTWIHVRGSAE